MPKGRRKKQEMAQSTCGLCGAKLAPGIAHNCPMTPKPNLDWIKWAAFLLQFLVLFGTLMWKASSLQNDLQYMKDEQNKEEKRLETIENYFKRPLPASSWSQ